MAMDWAVIARAVQEFHDTKGWWPSQQEVDALVSAQSSPAATPAAASAASTTVGSGPDSLVLKVSQDAWQGNAQYRVIVDGWQIGGVQTASAPHGSGQSDTITVRGDWGPGSHWVEVEFLNDAWGGTDANDRNLHLDSASYNGAALGGAAAALKTAGSAGFGFTEAAAASGTPRSLTAGSGSGTLELKLSQDAWGGDARYTVKVDGQQIGGTFTAGAVRGSGQTDSLTLQGEWSTGDHSVEVNFLNDAYGGNEWADRNLYLEGASINGQEAPGATLALMSAGPQSVTVADRSAPVTSGAWTSWSEFASQPSFADEFDGGSVDAGKWPITYGGGGVSSNQAFRWDGSEVSVWGGALHIGMEKRWDGAWDVGGVASMPNQWHPGFGFTYGKVEIMAKVSQEVWGTGPVFLLWPAGNDRWPPEVDILETPQGNGMFTNHWRGPGGSDEYKSSLFDVDLSQWHVYGLEWTPDRLTMTVDGQVMVSTTENVPHEPMSIALQGHVGAAHEEWYGGSPNGSGVNRVDIAVDYVRVYDWVG